jgi:macrophage erythroblast attacher
VVPYAHHTKSEVASDPVVLPNMRIYGREQLEDFARRIRMREGWVRDPVTGEEWEEGEVRAVFIS